MLDRCNGRKDTFDIGFDELQLYDVAKTLIELGAHVNAYRPGSGKGEILLHPNGLSEDRTTALRAGLFLSLYDSDAESEEVLKVGVDLDDDDDSDAESEEVLKVGIHLDGIHGSEMKCDSVNFKDCIGNVINCIELGTRCKQIRFDANRIDVIDYHNPMRRSLDHATKKFVCNRQKMSNLQDGFNLVRDRPCDVLALLEIEPGILTTPMTDTEYKLLAQYQDLLEVLSKGDSKGTCIEHGFKRAFMSLFGEDNDTFTSTMLLNVDQLQKQLDKDEFQEDGSMPTF
ncbi:hypothetical protein Tco_0167888 [Tanacetum coccineum]